MRTTQERTSYWVVELTLFRFKKFRFQANVRINIHQSCDKRIFIFIKHSGGLENIIQQILRGILALSKIYKEVSEKLLLRGNYWKISNKRKILGNNYSANITGKLLRDYYSANMGEITVTIIIIGKLLLSKY